MTALLEMKTYTPEDLLSLDGDVLYELVNGDLVEKNMGGIASDVGSEILWTLRSYCKKHRNGHALGEASFQCFPQLPGRVRIPDVAFIASGKLPNERVPEGHILVPPDLAVEVVSPNDSSYDVETKGDEYIAAKVRHVWFVYPKHRSVRIRRLNGPVSELRGSEIISGEDILPGFSCPVSDFFQTI